MVGLVGHHTSGFEAYYVKHRLSDSERELYALIQTHTRSDPDRERVDDGACRFSAEVTDERFEARFERCAATHGRAIVVIGDFHGINVFNILAKAGVSEFVVGVVQGGCRPHRDRPRCQYKAFDGFLERWSGAIAQLIFHQSGAYFLRDKRGRVDSPAAFEPGAAFVVDQSNVDKVITYLERLGARVPTLWLGPFVEARVDFRDFHLLRGGLLINERSLAHFSQLDAWLERQIAEQPRAFAYVSMVELMGVQRDFLRVGSCITYRDRDHFSACGEDLVARQVKAAYDAGAFVPSR
jgi:hypothetical protein